jgi:ABC-2 type transport system ATP-binding protein
MFGYSAEEIVGRPFQILLAHPEDLTLAASSEGHPLMHAPRILIVDEPTVGMDPRGARLLKRIFRDLAADGATVFMSTHSLEVAEELCDQIGIILRGRLVALGTVDELHEQAGRHDGATLESVFRRLTGAAADLDTDPALSV